MYDSLAIKQRSENLKGTGYLKTIPSLLQNCTHSIKYNGIEYYTGNLGNLTVTLSELGLSIRGSINKYWHLDNFSKMTRQEIQFSIEKLQDILNIPLYNASIRKIDIAHNFIMDNEVHQYYSLLGNCNNYKRLEQADSVYYNNSLKTKLFYDKIKEGKARGLEIPEIWTKHNVLRYELRFKSRLNKLFNKNEIVASDLFEESFYINIIDLWTKEYVEIKKNKLLSPNIHTMTSRNAKEYLLSALIQIIGHNEVAKLAEQWKDNFSTSKEAQRFKKSLLELRGLTEESPLINELDKKVMRVKEYYR